MQIKISVIVTVYNRLENLILFLKAFREQSEMPDEIIIADDGSQEDIINGISKLIRDIDTRIVYVRQVDRGFRLSKSRNNGARVSQGDFLFFLDQDVVVGRNFIKDIRKSIKNNNFLLIKPVIFNPAQKQSVVNIENGFGKEVLKRITFQQSINYWLMYLKDNFYYVLHSFWLRKYGPKLKGMGFGVAKTDYIKVNGFDEKYNSWGYEDDDFKNRLYAVGISGKPVLLREIPVHIFHEVNKHNNKNKEYYYTRKKEINKNKFTCEYGYGQSLDSDEVKVLVLK